MIDGLFRKQGNSLVPSNSAAEELLRRMKDGREIGMAVVGGVNPRHLAYYWSLIDKALQNTEKFSGKEELHEFLKLKSGHIEIIVTEGGNKIYRTKSVKIMSNDEFKMYVEGCKRIIAEQVLGVTENELNREIEP